MRPVFLIVLLILLYSCGHPEDYAIKPEEDTSGQNRSELQLAVKPARPQAVTIEIKMMMFEPEDLQINKGDTVVWINHDLVNHCITEEKSKSWSSGALPNDSTWKKVFMKDANYFCAIHLVMKGRIRVQ